MVEDTTVNMFWHGTRLPPLAWACMCSFIDRGHRLRVFSYGTLALPPGAELADARNVVSDPTPLSSHEAIAGFSDLFRYALLHRYGGWWADTDVYCMTDRLPPEPYAWAEQEPGIINGAILKFPRDDRLCGRLLKAASKKTKKGFTWGVIGPDLLSKMVRGRTDLLRSGTTATFYPWGWREAFLIWFPQTKQEVIERAKGALFLHFWDFALRNMGMDAFRDPPPGSYWADLIENSPNRAPSDAQYHKATDDAVRDFGHQHWQPDSWQVYLARNPGLLSRPAA